MKTKDLIELIAQELQLNKDQISNTVELLQKGNTIPFIARYRKEWTGNLDEVQLRDIRDRLEYLTELEERKLVILKSIEDQNKLDEALKQQILAVQTKQALEDLYLPYKPKRRTRATIARGNGLEPLALLIRQQEDYSTWLNTYLVQNEHNLDTEKALVGAQDIIAEWIAEDATLKEQIREISWKEGVLSSKVRKEFDGKKSKFEMYYDFEEPLVKIPAHRILALRRGEEESVLRIDYSVPVDAILALIADKWISPQKESGRKEIKAAIEDAYRRLIAPSIEVELRLRMKIYADEESIQIFSENLRNLLLASPAGSRMILGLDPGFRTGTKWTVVATTGELLEYGTIYPVAPQNQIKQSEQILQRLYEKHHYEFVCVGNGTASREVMQFVRGYLKKLPGHSVKALLVNESGASVYSASENAREEFPDLDVSIRGAVSIARRFQDPLAELVKIDPKSIGVGQYQHDVEQKKLKKSLDETVESCVNFVGVELNTASASLLSYVSGIGTSLAKKIMLHREKNGLFHNREELLQITGFGNKTYEQSAGFLRIANGVNPLDKSAVHPERYNIVLKMAEEAGVGIENLIGNEKAVNKIDAKKYVSTDLGEFTLKDILEELKRPGRDPRSEFKELEFDENICDINDLQQGMLLEGKVTNLTKFGAFIDIGVHQDGLVHVSEMSDNFIKDPAEICSVGKIVKVKILSIDLERKRISLSMKKSPGIIKKKTTGNFKQDSATKTTGNFNHDFAKLAEKFNQKQ